MSLKYSDNSTKIVIDYLTFTVKVWDLLTALKSYEDNVDCDMNLLVSDEENLTDIILNDFLLGRGAVDFQMQKARQGYAKLYTCNGITYAYGGCNTVMVQMSGTGCRYFETLNPNITWYTFLWQLKAKYATMHVSRLDVACDTFGMLDMNKIIQTTFDKKYVSIWRNGVVKQGIMDSLEKTVIFGSAKSDFLLRIYDKTAERLENVSSDIAVPEGWVRCEFQLRNDRAGGFIKKWQELQNIGAVYYGVMYDYLKFYTEYDGKHSDRLVLTKWWSKFLGDTKRVKITYEGGLEYNLERLKTYVYHQAGSSIKTLFEVNGGDLSEFLNSIDSCHCNSRQIELIALQKSLLEKSEKIDLPLKSGTIR